MSFNNTMNTILPQIGSATAHVTGDYGETRPNGNHGGVGFNYQTDAGGSEDSYLYVY
jgi:hypothetical protein